MNLCRSWGGNLHYLEIPVNQEVGLKVIVVLPERIDELLRYLESICGGGGVCKHMQYHIIYINIQTIKKPKRQDIVTPIIIEGGLE